MSEKVRKNELASFEVYGIRQEDGSLELGHTDETRTVEEWPDTMSVGSEYADYGLEHVDKEMIDGSVETFYRVEEVPNEPGIEWGVYL